MKEEKYRQLSELTRKAYYEKNPKELRRIHKELRKLGDPGISFLQRYPHIETYLAAIYVLVLIGTILLKQLLR